MMRLVVQCRKRLVSLFVNNDCGNEIEVSGETGMAHAGVVSAEVWCDECGKHYTGSETRTKFRKQQED